MVSYSHLLLLRFSVPFQWTVKMQDVSREFALSMEVITSPKTSRRMHQEQVCSYKNHNKIMAYDGKMNRLNNFIRHLEFLKYTAVDIWNWRAFGVYSLGGRHHRKPVKTVLISCKSTMKYVIFLRMVRSKSLLTQSCDIYVGPLVGETWCYWYIIIIRWLVLVSPHRNVLMSSLSDLFLCSKDCRPRWP